LLTTGAVASSARVVSKTPTPIVRVVFVNILVPLKKTFNINKIDITLRTLLLSYRTVQKGVGNIFYDHIFYFNDSSMTLYNIFNY
jgi:hypothetical protein